MRNGKDISLLEVKSLTKAYSSITALSNLTFEISEPSIVVVLGPNGSGKTTLVRLIAGILNPTSGEIRVFGHPPRALPPSLRELWGFVFQGKPGLYEGLTVGEHFELFRHYYTNSESVEEISRKMGLENILERPAVKLSTGQQKRVELGLALLARPSFLLLDEPTSSLDIDMKAKIWQVLSGFREAWGTILLTTHDAEEVEVLAERVLVLNAGKLLFDGTKEAFLRLGGSVRASYNLILKGASE